MKDTLSIEPVISSYISRPEPLVEVEPGVFEVIEEKVEIIRLGCRIEKYEPKETYTLRTFMRAMKPGWKGEYQQGWTWDSFFTCSCGHAGCAGYHENVRIHRKKKTVRVMGKVSDGYKEGVVGTGQDVVYFDKVQWDAVRKYYIGLFREKPESIFQDNDMFFTGKAGLKIYS